MQATIKLPQEYYMYICPPEFKRKRTKECERDALNMLKSYKRNGMISQSQYEVARERIETAPHDDAISNIMTRVRHKIKW